MPPLYPNKHYHHVTLRYGVGKSEVGEFVGRLWAVEAYTVAHNARAQACRVRTNGLPDEYGAPHVTLSTARGIKPFASVAMLKDHPQETWLEQPLLLTGVVHFEYIDQVKG